MALIIAGLFGFVTAASLKDEALRLKLLRYSAKWLLCPFLLYLASAWWYRAALPPALSDLIFQRMPEAADYLDAFLVLSPLLLLGGLLMTIRQPARLSRTLAGVMLLVGLLNLGAFEFLRESGRRPYIIPGYMYATAIRASDLQLIADRGVLQSARWAGPREITADNRLTAGKEVFTLLCLSCHSIKGPLNDIKDRASELAPGELELIISSMGGVRAYMPPFVGTADEKQALVAFIKSL